MSRNVDQSLCLTPGTTTCLPVPCDTQRTSLLRAQIHQDVHVSSPFSSSVTAATRHIIPTATLARTLAGHFQHQSPPALYFWDVSDQRGVDGGWKSSTCHVKTWSDSSSASSLRLSDESGKLQTAWIFDKQSRGMDRRTDGREVCQPVHFSGEADLSYSTVQNCTLLVWSLFFYSLRFKNCWLGFREEDQRPLQRETQGSGLQNATAPT